MSIIGKESPELRKAKEQRKIEKIKAKTEREKLRNKAKAARIDARTKQGGVGATISLYDKRDIPAVRKKGRK